MPSLSDAAVRLYRRVFGAPPGASLSAEGLEVVLDGNDAVAVAEAGIAQHVVLGGSFPAGGASAWSAEFAGPANLHGTALSAGSAQGPRSVIAAATGLALAGRRATAFLSGPDVAAAQDLLAAAAGRHAPLVLHLTNRALAAHGGALGGGHEAFYLSRDSGFFLLFAANVQQAVDFTYIARRVAERTLIPGLVAMDSESTALAVQDVRLLSPGQVNGYLGPAGEAIEVPTAAQKLLFGETRRSVPRWHDLDRPVLNGALYGPESFALGALANRPYFQDYLDESLAESLALFAQKTGRRHGLVSHYELDDAEIVLLVQGGAIETARAVARHVRENHKVRIGVVGVHSFRPFPAAEIAACLSGKRAVVVLERVDAPLGNDGPLSGEVRAALDRALSNGGRERTEADYPVLAPAERPRCFSVSYGIGGLPLRAADLVCLCSELESRNRSHLVLGAAFDDVSARHPKREVLLDTLRRAYPDVGEIGVRGSGAPPDLRPEGALTVAIHRMGEHGATDLFGETASLLQTLEGGCIRSRRAFSWDRWSTCNVDFFTHAETSFQDPGDEVAVDFAVVAEDQLPLPFSVQPEKGLRDGGAMLIHSDLSEEALWPLLQPELQRAIQGRGLQVFCATPRERVEAASASDPLVSKARESEFDRDHLLGSLFGALVGGGFLEQKERKVFSTRQHALDDLSPPRRDELTEVFQSGFRQVRRLSFDGMEVAQSASSRRRDGEASVAAQRLGPANDHYASLPRFWDQIGVLVRDGEVGALTADPYLSTGTMPSLSSTFSDASDSRAMLPVFDPVLCTGCGRCWTRCPDSAIGVVAISPAALIDTGIKMAGADAVRQVASQLAGRVRSQGKQADRQLSTAGEMLEEAFSWLREKMTLSDERQEAIKDGLGAVIERVGPLPLAVTEPFFDAAEEQKKDGGELLSLVINPDTCKACELCIAACETEALYACKQDEGLSEQARLLWKCWTETPDSSSDTIERISEDPEIGPMAAILLSRFCQFAMAGGDGAEAGSGEKIAVRLALAATEYQQQPHVLRFAQALEKAGEAIKSLIRETLADTLPIEDLEAVAQSLDRVLTPRVDLETLTDEVESAVADHTVDVSYLRRLIDLASRLASCRWQLVSGEQGLGRARFGLAVAPGSVATWAGAFPDNPFQAPVVLDMTGDAAPLAAGLMEGQLCDTAEVARALREAQLEIDQPAGADWKREELNRMTWRDLSDEEFKLCPPMILIGSDEILAGRGLAQVIWLLNSGLPVKILVLGGLDFGIAGNRAAAGNDAATRDPQSDLGLVALAQSNVYVAQASVAYPAQLNHSVLEALNFRGAALVHVHAPSPARHGFAATRTVEQARLAVASRALPLFRYNPAGEGVFGTRLNLDGNPEIGQVLVAEGEGQQGCTPAHWAATEQRFVGRFSVLGAEDAGPTELEAFLALDAKTRAKKTPFIAIAGAEGEVRYKVDSGLVGMVEDRIQIWRTLQEVAGAVTPFTAKVEQEIQSRVAAEHRAEIDAQKQDAEQRIVALRQEAEAEIAAKIRGRLLELAARKRA